MLLLMKRTHRRLSIDKTPTTNKQTKKGLNLVPVNLESEDKDVDEGNVSDVSGDGTSGAKVLSHLLDGHGFLEELQETMGVQLIELSRRRINTKKCGVSFERRTHSR